MSQYVTTHNAEGKAVFSQRVPREPHQIPLLGDASHGTIQIVYSNNDFAPNLSSEADIDEFNKVRIEGLPPGSIIPPSGTATSFVTLGPDAESPWHRTMTLDTLIIIEGSLEYYLDSGETKILTAGDTIVQRGVMHKWKNITPNGGRARTFGFGQPIQQPLEVGGQKLETEWRI